VAGVTAVARTFGARDVGFPVAFDWTRRLEEVVDADVVRADDWGGHGSIAVVDAPAWLAIVDGLIRSSADHDDFYADDPASGSETGAG
jgi:hypothetical protein